MKKSIAFVLSLFLMLNMFAGEVENVFEYDCKKQQTGTVSFYKVSNLDKEECYEFASYQKAEKTFFELYDLSNIFPQIQVGTQEFNSDYFCYDYSSNYNPFTYARIKNTNDKCEIKIDLETKKVTGEISAVNMFKKIQSFSGKLDLPCVPAYEVSGFQTDLWYAMRFIKDSCREFTACAYTVLKPYNEKIAYCGEEKIGGKLCDKWEGVIIDKKGKSTDEKQIFWFDKSDGYYQLVKSEVHIKGGVFQNAIVELIDEKTFTLSEWESYVEQKTEAIRVKLNIPQAAAE